MGQSCHIIAMDTPEIGHFRVSDNTIFRIISGTLTDYSGLISVDPGAPALVVYSPVDTATASVNEYIADSLTIKVTDVYQNLVVNGDLTVDGTITKTNQSDLTWEGEVLVYEGEVLTYTDS